MTYYIRSQIVPLQIVKTTTNSGIGLSGKDNPNPKFEASPNNKALDVASNSSLKQRWYTNTSASTARSLRSFDWGGQQHCHSSLCRYVLGIDQQR